MPDLFDQLRGYGRQIEADLRVSTSQWTPPTESDAVEGAPRPRRAPRRSAWVLVAAATAALALAASLLLPATPDDEGATATGVVGQPSPSATADAPPGLFDGSPEIAAGTYGFDLRGVPMQITVPAGWVRHEDFYLTAGPEDTSDGFIAFFDVTDVYKDPCNWNADKSGIGPAVDDLVAGLQAQPRLQTSTPKPLVRDGFTGTELAFATPAALDLSTCYTGTFALWTVDVGGPTDRQISSNPGDTGTIWIFDLNGKRGVISFGSNDPTSTTSAQIMDMVDSLMIG